MIRLSKAADADLGRINQWFRPRAEGTFTDRIIETILTAIGDLAVMPMRGRPGRRAGTRELVISRYPYVVIYRLMGDDVEIVRVMHTRQQWPRPKRG